MRGLFLYTLIFICIGFNSWAQPGTQLTLDQAEEHYGHKNYLMAIPIFKAELQKDPANKELKYKLGICFLRTKISRIEAIKYLEEYTKDPKCEEEAWFYLGRAYLLNNKLTEAIAAFEKYKTLKPKKEVEATRFIENCHNAQKFMSDPGNITFTNLGKEINSDHPDYYPFVSADETFLAFTSRRKDGVGGKKVEVDGYHPSDIYFSHVENGNWTKVINAGRILNGALDEQAVGLKSDGLEMYVYLDHIEKFGDLYISSRKDVGSEFGKPHPCDPHINEKIETSGCLSEDGQTMFFARKPKIDENSDIWICRKLPNGKWAIPQKLPDLINTKYNEDFPYLSNDGKTLYFSSEGHNSMGGYDLFRTTWDAETNNYTEAVNLGYPVNSTDDDRNICVTPDNRVAYISAFRPGGFGDLDIYRIKFNDNEQINKIFIGKVFMGDTIASHQPKTFAISMIVTNKKTKGELLYTPHTKSGRYVISLPVGKYSLVINSEGYKEYVEELNISDIGKIEMQKNKNFVLKKK